MRMNHLSPPAARWLVSVFDNTAEPAFAESAGNYVGNVLADTVPTVAEAAVSTGPAGSRRRKLWELPQGTLCPLMGVCLPIATLRRVLSKTLGGTLGDDYQVHCAAINECTCRSASCDALQRELDLRHTLALQRFAKAKTTEAVAALWLEASAGSDPAGALWAGLTHPRCDGALRERICSDIHMLQHQLGAGNRADLQRMQALTTEQAALKRELAATRERSARALAERNAQMERQAAQLMRLRAEGIQKDRVNAALREDLAAAESTAPARADPSHELRTLQRRSAQLERELERAQRAAAHEADRANALAAQIVQPPRSEAEPLAAPSDVESAHLASLRDAAVLCVGGRTASVPAYRRLIEVTGGHFAHHDGGEQQSTAQLEASLVAADLVICQTGCISHDAYWRVKEHCKRTGKRCVFVDNPSAASFARSLRSMPALAKPPIA